MNDLILNDLIRVTVCDKCFRACCWQGEFMCDQAQTAGTIDLPIMYLKKLKREHPSYWDIDPNTGCRKRTA